MLYKDIQSPDQFAGLTAQQLSIGSVEMATTNNMSTIELIKSKAKRISPGDMYPENKIRLILAAEDVYQASYQRCGGTARNGWQPRKNGHQISSRLQQRIQKRRPK